MKKCIILANGRVPSKREILFLKKIGFNKLLCADGGANSAYKLNLIPDIIIGDLDSIRQDVLDYNLKNKVEIKKIKRQNDTDVEKCIKYAISKKCEEIILLGATGDRLDHTFCNLGIALKYFGLVRISIFHEKSFLSVYKGVVNLKAQVGEVISIYGFDSKTKFSSSGLKYPLQNVTLEFGKRESTSNVAMKDEVVLQIKNGLGFIVRDFEVMKRNGFLL